jgi:hypothetical protein
MIMVSNFATAPQEEVSQKQISSSPIFEAIVSFFKEENWQFFQDEDRPILRMNYQGKNGSWRCMAQAAELEAIAPQRQVLMPTYLDRVFGISKILYPLSVLGTCTESVTTLAAMNRDIANHKR